MGQTTITVSDETLARFREAKARTKGDNVPEMSSDGFINALLDTQEQVKKDGYDDPLPDDVREQLDRIESAASTAEGRTGEIQQTLEALQR